MNTANSFATGKLFPMILKFSIPAAISLLISAIYNIVDRIFVGNFVGTSALAGLSICFPLSYMMMAFGLMCSAGGSTCFSLFSGQGETRRMNRAFGNAFVAQRYGVALSASQADEFLLQHMPQQCQAFGIPFKGEIEPIGHYIDHGDIFTLGTEEIRAIAVPGHSPGSLAFYAPESGFVLSGDALFQLSIGRTDFPGGNHRQLIESIHKNLLTLPPETVVYPGHGPETEIGIERNENPFL